MAKDVMDSLDDLRCQCGKIVCQLQEQVVVIKCRHCKRFIIISTKGFETTGEGDRKIDFK